MWCLTNHETSPVLTVKPRGILLLYPARDMLDELPQEFVRLVCDHLVRDQQGRTLLHLGLTSRQNAATALPLMSKIPFNISTWSPGLVLPTSPGQPIILSSPVSMSQIVKVSKRLKTDTPLFETTDGARILTVCPLAVLQSEIPVRYLAHYIAAFIHPAKISLEAPMQPVDEDGRRKLVWLVRDLRKLCR